ncbi:MAG: transposase family protein, partial [Akkermansia sp.]|nr:transposase family protein [Akkermansia sp.]
MRNIIKYMSQVNDFRDGFNLKHKLVDILTIAVLAVLSGVETWDDMELYGK